MFLTTLTIVTQLQQPKLEGIALKPSYSVTEPLDVQPAASTWTVQQTLSVHELQPACVIGTLQPTVGVGNLQRTCNPQQPLSE